MTEDLSREIFGNLGETSKVIFYALAFISSGVFAWGVWRRVKLWRRGRPDNERIDWKAAFQNLRTRALAQRKHGHHDNTRYFHRLLPLQVSEHQNQLTFLTVTKHLR